MKSQMISAIGNLQQAARQGTPSSAPSGVGFDAVMDGVDSVDDQQLKADGVLGELASGKRVDLHGTFIELEKADIALRTMVSVRNKLVGAYEQVMNMSI